MKTKVFSKENQRHKLLFLPGMAEKFEYVFLRKGKTLDVGGDGWEKIVGKLFKGSLNSIFTTFEEEVDEEYFNLILEQMPEDERDQFTKETKYNLAYALFKSKTNKIGYVKVATIILVLIGFILNFSGIIQYFELPNVYDTLATAFLWFALISDNLFDLLGTRFKNKILAKITYPLYQKKRDKFFEKVEEFEDVECLKIISVQQFFRIRRPNVPSDIGLVAKFRSRVGIRVFIFPLTGEVCYLQQSGAHDGSLPDIILSFEDVLSKLDKEDRKNAIFNLDLLSNTIEDFEIN